MSTTAGSTTRRALVRPGRQAASARVQSTAQLRRAQRYAPYRRVLGAVAHRRTALALTATGVVLAAVALPVLGRLLAHELGPATLTTALVLAIVTLCLVAARRAVGTHSRTQVTHPADVGLLQALDLRASEVFWVFVGRRVVLWHLAVLLAALGIMLGADSATHSWPVLALPVGSAVLTVGLAARMASRPVVVRAAVGILVVQTAAATGLGVAAGRGVAAVAARGSLVVPDSVARAVAAGAGPVAGLAVVLGVALAADAVPRLRALSWSTARAGGGERPVAASEYARLRTMVMASPLAHSVLGVWRAVVLAAAAGAGVVLAGVTPSPQVRTVLGPLLTGYAFVTVLVASGVVFSLAGPSVVIDRLRFRWENSVTSASRIAAETLHYPLAVVVTPSALLALAQSVMLAHVAARTLALGIALVGAAVIAESVLPVGRHADGTITHHPLSAWVVLLVSLPAAALPAGVVGSLLSTGYALAVLGAGHRCLTRRILRLPSSSAA